MILFFSFILSEIYDASSIENEISDLAISPHFSLLSKERKKDYIKENNKIIADLIEANIIISEYPQIEKCEIMINELLNNDNALNEIRIMGVLMLNILKDIDSDDIEKKKKVNEHYQWLKKSYSQLYKKYYHQMEY